MKNPKSQILNPRQIRIWKILILILFSVSCFGFRVSASAATFTIEVDTGRETINALEGTLILPKGVSAENIYTGNSAVSIWITQPKAEGGVIKFAGITPGGFRGKYALFSLEAASAAGLYFDGVRAYRSDGSGESVSVTLSLEQGVTAAEDSAPPEPFELLISNSPDVFGGKYFISFAAADKGTGIERYEFASTWLLSPDGNKWLAAESPFVLGTRDLFKAIHIRAIDRTGNIREISTHGPYRYPILLISSIIAVCVLLLSRRSFRSFL